MGPAAQKYRNSGNGGNGGFWDSRAPWSSGGVRQENTSGAEKQASGAGAKRGWRRVMSLAGPVAVGVAGLAAAAGVGYVRGEKAGAARAVAHEIFTREHRELREIQEGVERVKQTIAKIRQEELGATGAERPASNGIPHDVAAGIDGAPAPATKFQITPESGEAALQDAPASADRAASPNILPGGAR